MRDLSRRQSSRQKGDRGEELAWMYLAQKGYETLERNYRTRHGEIDLVVRGEHVLVFVLVPALTAFSLQYIQIAYSRKY